MCESIRGSYDDALYKSTYTLYFTLLLYLSLPLRHPYSVRHLGLVGSHDRNLSVSASGVFDILALYKLDYYYLYYYFWPTGTSFPEA